MTIGEKVCELRQARNWTLAYVSLQTGISLSHLSAIENGTRKNPSFSMIAKIAHLYGVPLAYFDEIEPELGDDDLEHPAASFIASENTSRYISFAKRLAENTPYHDASTLLKLIAEFLSDEKADYDEK